VDEPFQRLLCQGMVIKDGSKMSKSLGNVVDPGEIVDKYGADTARLFILFAALPEKELDWSDQGVAGSFRFLNRVYRLVEEEFVEEDRELNNADRHILGKMHRTVQKVTQFLEEFKLSLAIGAVMEYVNAIYKYTSTPVNKRVYPDLVERLALLMSPFTPHLAEEMWEKLGHTDFISLAGWPEYDESKIDLAAEAAESMVHQTISDIGSVIELTKMSAVKRISLILADQWKYDFLKELKSQLEKTRDPGIILKHFMSTGMKVYGQEITKLVPKLVKDFSKIPETVLDQDAEFDALMENAELIASEFDSPLEIVRAQDSKHAKAKQGMPGKPAIVLE